MASSSTSAGFYSDDNELPISSTKKAVAPAPSDADETNEHDSYVATVLKNSSHPFVASFHVLFKAMAITSYLVLGWVVNDFVIQFVVTVTLLAVDFWYTKNISGRMMVGLRYWNELDDGSEGGSPGGTVWKFETCADRNNVTDYRVFWYTLYVNPVVWIALSIVCVIKFHISWLIVSSIALILNGVNLWGYWSCDKEAQKRVQKAVGDTFLQAALDRFMPWGSSGGANNV
eukprot:CAMPEP_0184708014 /NCGR_PEP_ID=MMETSP0313-20130426/37562_1 /TAXON_ID=2792 /ORGANISM="Porphyridium aerugineum, Strain SAG 1380-2" /LENGTH=229 /DNA_ID=CAMNT_0027169595 /DNA_START=302 /DNA_END=991 /DNA_ORIENTATION=-